MLGQVGQLLELLDAQLRGSSAAEVKCVDLARLSQFRSQFFFDRL